MSLRKRLAESRIVLAPGVYDGFTTLFAERAASVAVTRPISGSAKRE